MTGGMVRRWSLVALVFVVALAGGAALLLRGSEPPPPAAAAPVSPNDTFASADTLAPPKLTVTGTASGQLFIAPKRQSGQGGPAILDSRGRLQWFHPMDFGIVADDFKVQTYEGEPVLTWWEGKTVPERGYGSGTWVIADHSYKEIATVKAVDGLTADLHEMVLTDRGTAYIVGYKKVPADLSIINAFYDDGHAMDSVIQEIDVKTGKLVWEWSSLDHVGLTESYAGRPQKNVFPYDYFHINSVDENADGDLLISARNTHALYKIEKRTGDVVWRLGGRRSDFALGEGVRFAWQHDARWQPDGTITLFDNQATPQVGPESRVLWLRLDEERKTASVDHVLTHPDKILATAEGNAQVVGDRGAVVGWGLGRRVSQLDGAGTLLFDLKFPPDTDTYRAFTDEWQGEPDTLPVAAATRAGADVNISVSWNGATEVGRWTVLAGATEDALEPVLETAWAGFETDMTVRTDARFVAVRADGGATSEPVAVR